MRALLLVALTACSSTTSKSVDDVHQEAGVRDVMTEADKAVTDAAADGSEPEAGPVDAGTDAPPVLCGVPSSGCSVYVLDAGPFSPVVCTVRPDDAATYDYYQVCPTTCTPPSPDWGDEFSRDGSVIYCVPL